MTICDELLDELLKGCDRPEDPLGDAGLTKALKIRLMERMPGADLGPSRRPIRAMRKAGKHRPVARTGAMACRARG